MIHQIKFLVLASERFADVGKTFKFHIIAKFLRVVFKIDNLSIFVIIYLTRQLG